MKYRIDLKISSSNDWINAVIGDFDTFLTDHANCERKASAMAMSFVAKYPNRKENGARMTCGSCPRIDPSTNDQIAMPDKLCKEDWSDFFVKFLVKKIDHEKMGEHFRALVEGLRADLGRVAVARDDLAEERMQPRPDRVDDPAAALSPQRSLSRSESPGGKAVRDGTGELSSRRGDCRLLHLPAGKRRRRRIAQLEGAGRREMGGGEPSPPWPLGKP